MEEKKAMYCWGREILDHEIYYLKELGIDVVPKLKKHRLGPDFYTPTFTSGDETVEAIAMDDEFITVEFPQNIQKLHLKGNSAKLMTEFYNHYISYAIKDFDNGFYLLLEEKKYVEESLFVKVSVDLLNNIDITVGKINNGPDCKMRIPVGNEEYHDATLYLNGIITAITSKGKYHKDEIEFLKLGLGDPRLIERVNNYLKEMPKDIKTAFDIRERELREEAKKQSDAIYRKLSRDVQALTVLRENALACKRDYPSGEFLIDNNPDEVKGRKK